MDIFILYLIIIDSYGAHSIETYLNRPKNKPVLHVWTVKTSSLQELNSLQTSVKAGRARCWNSLYVYITNIAQSNIY